MGTTDEARHRLGTLLVALQFAAIAALAVFAGPTFLRGAAPGGASVLLAGSIALAMWALWCNRPGNFNIRPAPRVGGRLVQHGPYRWIRHPMYTSVMTAGVACAWAGSSSTTRAWWGWLGLVALAAVLVAKSAVEERWMLAHHPGYAAYRARSWRFVPWVV